MDMLPAKLQSFECGKTLLNKVFVISEQHQTVTVNNWPVDLAAHLAGEELSVCGN